MAKSARARMTVRLECTASPALFADIAERVARARGSRLKYLASLGLAAERTGLHLDGRVATGQLVVPGALPSPAAHPQIEDLDPLVDEHDARVGVLALKLLDMG